MPLFLVPIVVGAAAGAGTASYLTREEAGDYSADAGGRQLDAHQIYQQLRAGDSGSSLMMGRESAGTLKNNFAQRVSQMDTLAKRMDEAWQGDSAEAAKAGAHPLKQWLQDSEVKLHESDNTMSSQLDAYSTVLSQVQPVPAQPPESSFLNDITPWTTDTDRAIQQYNAMAQANVEAYNAYYSVSNANGHSMPQYTTVDGEFGDVEVDGGGSGGGGGTGAGTDGGGYPGGGGGYPGGGGGSGGGGVPGGSYPGGGVGGGGVPGGSYPGGGGGGVPGGSYPGGSYPGGSYPGGTTPGGSYPGGGAYPGIGPGFVNPGEPDDSTNASRFVPTAPGTDFTPIGGGGGGIPSSNLPGGGSGGGGLGPGGGTGALGAGGVAGGALGAGAFGAGSPGAATGAASPGAASGMAGRAAMGGAAAAGAGARGMGGMPMGAMGGAGARGQGSEDEEHQTKYLVEEDGDSLFGSDELTAPPVIGE
ncbi:hypothetical protein ABT332_10055 [Saccharomonospora azurea]|uniref:hypothetical protein n=1 Tax=Saccharomonospora azurea TaxID=40988 RepID=UPI0033302648